ncbi:MAG TPA: ubiquitin-like domain-containing protein [Anaerolineales bacterium]|nr:ubiquitin-like domain-containing protein [Anaerolineales bacterium]
MKLTHGFALAFTFFIFACQPTPLSTIRVIDNSRIVMLQTDERVPSALLEQAGLTLNPNDRILLNGLPIPPNQPIPNLPSANSPITLQIRRAMPITLITRAGEKQLQSSAFTVGELLEEAATLLHARDKIEPGLDTPIAAGMKVAIISPDELTVSVDGKVLQIQSSAGTVGEALAEAGIPLIGLDYSLPAENETLPSDRHIRVVRVSESVVLAQRPMPFESETRAASNVLIDQTQILQPGETGLAVQRVRIRYEDGEEIARLTEAETMVRPPKTRIVGYGTKIEIKTAVVDGVKIEYWRAVQMFATSYSPCRLGVAGLCSKGTASGLPAKKGVVGMIRSWYNVMQGQRFYIPGYGIGVLGDLGAGYPDGRPLIDLAYSDNDYVGWHKWVTVYFLTPVPNSIIYVLQ